MKIKRNYIIITPAKNEAANIQKTILSVVAQTILPKKWVIVNDGSTDETDKLVEPFLNQYNFISLVNVDSSHRDFASKVHAFNTGFETIKNIDYDFIGNLDADISFSPDYFERLLEKFSVNPRLGIGGGYVLEEHKGILQNRFGNSTASVAGGVQLFRRECYHDIGGYLPLEFGFEDIVSQIYANMLSWKVESFPDIQTIHHGKFKYGKISSLHKFYKEGQSEFVVGYHPLFEILKFINRIPERPFFLGALFRITGYFFSWLNPKIKQITPQNFVKFLRYEQIQRMQFFFKRSASTI